MKGDYRLVLENAMDPAKQKMTLPLFFSVWSATIGSSFLFGYNTGVINAPAELIQSWIKNESYPSIHGRDPSDRTITEIWCWTVAIFTLAGTIGGLLCGYVADKLGRKGAMMVNTAVAILGAVLMGISKVTNLYILLLIGRLISGINCGISSALPPMYLTEIAPLRLRGLLGNANTFVVILGIFIAQVFGVPQLLGTETLWPILLAFNIVPALLQLVSLPFCPESPKYLLLVKRKEKEAEAALIRLRKTADVGDEMKAMLEEMQQSSKSVECATKSNTQSFWWPMTICLVNHFGQQLSGMNGVLFFSSIMFRDQAQLTNEQSIGATLGVGAVFIAAGLVSTLIMDRVGRRVLMLGGVAGTCFFNIMIFVCLHLLAIDGQKYHAAAYGAIVMVYLFVTAFAMGPSSIPWFYVSELFDQSTRGKASMIATTTNWLCGFLVGYSFLPLKEAIGEFVFLIFASIMVLCFIFIYLFAPETKGRQHREIAKELEAKKPRCFR